MQYQVNGINIAANVYTPANYNAKKKYPAVAVAHPNGGIKEQIAGLYAQRLAEAGYIAITADAAYQGASGGTPRYIDKPQNRVEDIFGMADFIGRYPGVDSTRIGLLGICGGGGYSLKAAQSDKRFKAVATIQQRLKKAADARAQMAAGGEIQYEANTSADQVTDAQIAALPFDLYRQGFEYYFRTHAHPNSSPRYTTASLMDLMAFDATNQIELINQPLLMMAGSKADTLYMTEQAFPLATGTQNKELFLIPGATHIETYWKPEYVQQVVDKLRGFYGKNL